MFNVIELVFYPFQNLLNKYRFDAYDTKRKTILNIPYYIP